VRPVAHDAASTGGAASAGGIVWWLKLKPCVVVTVAVSPLEPVTSDAEAVSKVLLWPPVTTTLLPTMTPLLPLTMPLLPPMMTMPLLPLDTVKVLPPDTMTVSPLDRLAELTCAPVAPLLAPPEVAFDPLAPSAPASGLVPRSSTWVLPHAGASKSVVPMRAEDAAETSRRRMRVDLTTPSGVDVRK
jgi:hypothetical protein